MSAKFSNQFSTARRISKAAGVDKATIRRRAALENWPVKRQGNRFLYRAPVGYLRKSLEFVPEHVLRAILDKDETLRALDRAAAVNGFARELRRDPRCGVEMALARTVSNFRHLKNFSIRGLRRWIDAVLRGGLGALHENRFGRVGRRARALSKILK